MAEVGSALVTSFVIRELTGDKRRLVLRKRALPYRPFELSGTQRNTVDWYPGSPIGTLQVYGAKEEPTTISGAWKDKFISEHLRLDSNNASAFWVSDDAQEIIQFIDDVRQLVKLVDDIRRKGQEVEVTWLDQARRGIMDRFTARWQTGHDVDWEMGFVWSSQAESFNEIPVVDAGTGRLIGDLPNEMQDRLNTVGDTTSVVPSAGDRFSDIGAQLGAVAANLQDFVDGLADAVTSVGDDVATPIVGLKRVAGILDGIKLEADQYIDTAENAVDGATLDLGAILSFGKLLSVRANVRESADAATDMRNLAASRQYELIRRITADVIRVFQARDGMDLRTVSTQFYGTPDEWRSLMVFNNLLSSGLVAGQVVFVPANPDRDLC